MRSMMILALLSVCLCADAAAQTISASEAAKHIGERATVCGNVAGEHTSSNSRGAPTFINIDQPYPNQVFTLLVWGNDRASVGALPKIGKLCATGVIAEYKGLPEIVLHDAQSWYVPK